MINESLGFLVNQVNEYITLKTGGDSLVELNGLVDQQGNLQIAEDRVACTLVSITEERLAKSQVTYQVVNGVSTKKNPVLKFNLFIVFAANPKIEAASTNYPEGLKLISHIITFFQGKNVFDKYNSPGMPDGLEKLVMEIYNLPVEEQSYLWGSLGAKYMPSILYRVRLVTMDDDLVQQSQPAITGIKTIIEDKLVD